MKLGDAIRLGHLNISAHKRRSMMILVVMGAIFGILFAGTMLLQGLENGLLDVLVQPTDGEVFLTVGGGRYAQDTFDGEQVVKHVSTDEVEASIEKFGGKSWGELGMWNGTLALPEEVGRRVAEINPDQTPEGEIPFLASISQASYFLKMSIPQRGKPENRMRVLRTIQDEAVGKSFEASLDTTYYVVGLMPGAGGANTLALETVGSKTNPLDIILGRIPVGGTGSFAIAMEGMTNEVEMVGSTEVVLPYLVSFPSAKVAIDYSKSKGVCYESYFSCVEDDLVVNDVFGSVLGTKSMIDTMQLVMDGIGVVLVIVAFIVMYFTVMRLIEASRQTISLYYALGATKKDVKKIYGYYVLELGILALGFAMILGVVLDVVISLVNAEALSQVIYLAYGVENYRLWLLGWNNEVWVLMGAMLLLVMICFWGNSWQFSAKKLGKGLKK